MSSTARGNVGSSEVEDVDDELAKRMPEPLELGTVLRAAELRATPARELLAWAKRPGRDERSEVSACRARRDDEAMVRNVLACLRQMSEAKAVGALCTTTKR
jgi:hypothetical protein